MSELNSAVQMMVGFLLMIALITIPIMLFNNVKDATMQVQTNMENAMNGLSDTSSTTSDATTKSTTSVAQESGNKEETDKSNGGMSSFTKYLIWFIIPALLIGLLLGRHIFSYIRTSDDTQISVPWESRAEDDQSSSRTQRPQRPVSVADALENMLQTNTNAPTPSNSSSSTTNDKANAISDESASGIRVIREDSEETSLGEREQINEPEVKRVIR